jgi:aldehyde dehydrogenase (NAD+)
VARVPAPKRGEAVRLLGEELRAHKDALGSLVSLENGKIKAEGDGEVQEMIDIADFAVGQSRMLYGLTMHSERAAPHVRAVAPARRGRRDLGVQFSGRGVVVERLLAAICGNATVWKPSPKTALCALAVQRICNRVLERALAAADLSAVHRCGTELAAASSTTGASRWCRSPARPTSAARSACASRTRLGKSLLELGGNNAIIVDATANLDLAVPAHRVRRRRHRRPALHDDAARAGAPLARSPNSSGAWSRPTRRCASAIRWTRRR